MRTMVVLALARLTAANQLRQGLTWLCLGLAIALVGLSYLFGQFTFNEGDRLRLILTAGTSLCVLLGLFVGVHGASVAVHEELASRTALTLFAKPLGRGQFVLGKAMGVFAATATVQLLVALVHAAMVWVAWRWGFDYDLPNGGQTLEVNVPWLRLVLAHGLGLLHTLCLVCLATVLALRLNLNMNLIAGFAAFVLAHVLASLGFDGALVLPALGLFNADDAMQFPGVALDPMALVATLGYAVAFCTGLLCLGMAIFAKQDIP